MGAAGIILLYLIFTYRGLRVAMRARDDFSRLLATGLTSIFALQAFIIIGGVIKLIPLTGITLPFVSYGGSSVVANFVLLALLLRTSDRAASERDDEARRLAAGPAGVREVPRRVGSGCRGRGRSRCRSTRLFYLLRGAVRGA